MKKLFVMCICVLCILLCACANTNEGDTPESAHQSGSDINIENDATDKNQAVSGDLIGEIQESVDTGSYDNKDETKGDIIESNCNCLCPPCEIDMGDAILIAQGHSFALFTPDEVSYPNKIPYAHYVDDDEKTWTIFVGIYNVEDVDKKEHEIATGGGWSYVIDKATGKILEMQRLETAPDDNAGKYKGQMECSCDCHCWPYDVDMGDAILIAQGHYLKWLANQNDESYGIVVPSAHYVEDDQFTWTIHIWKYDVNPNDDRFDAVGGGLTYRIEKATGKIIAIKSGGE